jgi:hypothetical protein
LICERPHTAASPCVSSLFRCCDEAAALSTEHKPMPKSDADSRSSTDQSPLLPIGMVELDEASIAAVAGGLNPQPLPPGRLRLD